MATQQTHVLSDPPTSTNPTGPDVVTVDSDEYTIVLPSEREATNRVAVDDDEPLIDTTVAMPLNSKKTRRFQKQQHKRQQRARTRSKPQSFLDLPAELLQEVLSYLKPTDMFSLLALTRETRSFILQHEGSIARDIIRRRYWALARCFPLPVLARTIEESTQAALLNPRREKMLDIHWKPYQHIKRLDAREICSCASCHIAWNQLNVILDFAHFQPYLDKREPIPMIPRGTNPPWNIDLTEANAAKVHQALHSPLTYAAILQLHLASIVGTLLRQVRFPPQMRKHQHNSRFAPTKTVHPITIYSVTEKDAATGTDAFLERQGRECFEVPFSRDNYYNQWMYAYMPNRKWRREEREWVYGVTVVHEKDVAWARAWFSSTAEDLARVKQLSVESDGAAQEQLPTAAEQKACEVDLELLCARGGEEAQKKQEEFLPSFRAVTIA